MSNMMANVGLEFQFGGSKQKSVQEAGKAVPLVEKPSEPEAEMSAPAVSEPMETEIPPIVKTEPDTLILRIKFAFDSAKVEPAYHNVIEQAVQFLDEHPGVDAMIEGHTCSIGPEKYNMGLSLRRAESVKTYMINNFNVNGARLSTIGYGESRPDHKNSTMEGRQLNRRVVIRLEEE
jgi:OOP family OmpA-OmpF porin